MSKGRHKQPREGERDDNWSAFTLGLRCRTKVNRMNRTYLLNQCVPSRLSGLLFFLPRSPLLEKPLSQGEPTQLVKIIYTTPLFPRIAVYYATGTCYLSLLRKSGVNSTSLQRRKLWPVNGLQLRYSRAAHGKFGRTIRVHQR